MKIQRLRQFNATVPLAALISMVALAGACGEGEDTPAPEPTGADTAPVPPPPGESDGGETGDDGGETGGDGDETGGDDIICDTEQTWMESFLTDNCGECHGPGADPIRGGYNYVNSVPQLLGGGQMVMGSLEDSRLFQLIDEGTMPFEGDRLDQDDIDRIAQFISECDGPEPVDPNGGRDDCDPLPYLEYEDMLEAMADDISDVDQDDRPFTRYLNCSHLANQGYCGNDLQSYLDAVAKLMNSTSREGGAPEELEAIDDSEGTILRIDIRDFGWDEPVAADVLVDGVIVNLLFDDKWDALSIASPYGYVPDLGDDNAEALVEDAEEIIPFLLCDAFLEIGSRADEALNSKGLYHDLAEIPAQLFSVGNDDSLEELLDFDIQDNIDDEEVIRAGLAVSSAARGGVMAERHEGGNGEAVWIRYDYDGNQAQIEDVLFNPIDINQIGSFDNAEVLYSLPNELFAYMVVDGDGLRQDFLSANVFPDPALQLDKGSDTQVFLSCSGCHGGSPVRLMNDEVRDLYRGGNTPNGDIDNDDVEALYLEAEDFNEQVDEDNEEYLGALGRVVVNTSVDPVRRSYLQFRAQLDLPVVATELGFREDDLDVGDLDDSFDVLEDGRTVRRDSAEQLYFTHICDTNQADVAFCDGLVGAADQAQIDQLFDDELAIILDGI